MRLEIKMRDKSMRENEERKWWKKIIKKKNQGESPEKEWGEIK